MNGVKKSVLAIAALALCVGILVSGDSPRAQTDDKKPAAFADLELRRLGFYRQQLVEAFQQHGKRDPEWNDEADAFLDEMALAFASVVGRADERDLCRMGDVAIGAGCTDPLVATMRLSAETVMDDAGSPSFLTLAYELRDAGYSPMWSAYAAGWGGRYYAKEPHLNDRKQREAVRLLLKETRRLLTSDQIADGDERMVYKVLHPVFAGSKASLPEAAAEVDLLVQDAKQPHEQWLANMLAASFRRDLAWSARGGSFADKVTEEGWRLFYENLNQSAEHLRAAYRLKPTHPEAATEMIPVLANDLGDENESMYTWFERAVEAECDYHDAYQQMFNFSLPRWGGSHAQIEKIGRFGLRTGRYDTIAPIQYAFSLLWIARDDKTSEPRYWSTELPKRYPELKEMLNRYKANDKKPLHPAFLHSLHALFAFHAEQHEEALSELRLAGDKIHREARSFCSMPVDELIQKIHAFGGAGGNQVAEAKKCLRDNQVEAALKQIDEATQIYLREKDEPAIKLLANMKADAETRVKLDTFDWVNLTFDDALAGWLPVAGEWKRKDDKTVIGKPTSDGLELSLLAPLGHRFQVRGEVLIPKACHESHDAGMALVSTSLPFRRSLWFLIFPWQTNARVYFGMGPGSEGRRQESVRLGANRFDIVVWDNTTRVRLNGEQIFEGFWSAASVFGEDERISLVSWANENGPEAVFRDLQVRKLKVKPDDE